MRAGRTWPLAAAVIVVLRSRHPAAAHETALGAGWLTEAEHPRAGTGRAPRSKTSNFEMVGSVERTVGRQHVPQLGPRVLGPVRLRRPLRGLPDRRRRQPAQAEAGRRRRRLPRARNTTCRSGRACCSSRSRRRARARSATRSPRSPGLRGDPDLRRAATRGRRYLIKGVPTDCGSHTHTLVPDPRHRPRAALRRLVHGERDRRVPRVRERVRALRGGRPARRTTRSPSSRCRSATRPRPRSSASRGSRRTTTGDGLPRLP